MLELHEGSAPLWGYKELLPWVEVPPGYVFLHFEHFSGRRYVARKEIFHLLGFWLSVFCRIKKVEQRLIFTLHVWGLGGTPVGEMTLWQNIYRKDFTFWPW